MSSKHHLLAHQIAMYIERNTSERLTLANLAKTFLVGKTTLQLAFIMTYGCAPGKYIRQARIKRAKVLLLGSGLSVSEVGREVGYFNAANFATAFRHSVGMFPRQFRLVSSPAVS